MTVFIINRRSNEQQKLINRKQANRPVLVIIKCPLLTKRWSIFFLGEIMFLLVKVRKKTVRVGNKTTNQRFGANLKKTIFC